MKLILIVLLPLLGTVLAPLTERYGRPICALATALGPALALFLIIFQLPLIFAGEIMISHTPWLPSLGLNVSFRLDGLGAMFALLILGIGLLVILYALYYLKPKDSLGKLFGLLSIFIVAMLGIVLSENLMLLLVFWELTSLSSFLLISFWTSKSEARRGARMALTVTGAGGLALIAGFIMLGNIVGSFNLSDILVSGELIQSHPHYSTATILILIGCFAKSAQFPLHFWLPHAMSAPTPVSAYLHSATMVKAGVFLLARFHPALAGTDLWFYTVSSIGLITMVFAAFTAIFKHDLKGLLAYSTISHLGLITFLFGLNSQLATIAGLFHVINHATFKASLFMATGIIDHETGTRDMRKINGMFKYMPLTALLAMVAASAMAGVPLLNGFLSKEMFFAEAISISGAAFLGYLVPALATLAGIFSVAYSLRFIHDVFFNGEPIDIPIYPPKKPPRYMVLPIEVLVTLCLLVGILPNYTVAPFLNAAAEVVLTGPQPEYHIAIWHGLNLPLLMSFIAFAGGVLLYSQRKFIFRLGDRTEKVNMNNVFELIINRMVAFSRKVTDIIENGSLQHYMALLLMFATVVVAVQFIDFGNIAGSKETSHPDIVTVLLAAIAMAAAFGTALLHHNRFTALLFLSVVGLIVSLMFVRFSAPDLALTQLSVEVVTVVLIMLALYFFPQLTPNESSIPRVVRDIAIAVFAGGGLGLLTWSVLTRGYSPISDFFIENSVSGGGGSNVVNVILVDFRGFDTLGEITVLAIAAVGIYHLLHNLRLIVLSSPEAIDHWHREPHPPILAVMARILLPLALMVSAYIFLRGHNLPGGGFIAGLVTSVAIILQYVSSGTNWVQSRIRWEYRRTAAGGVLLACCTGLASFIFGYPFLTSTFTHVHWPIVGDFEIASAMAFDAGVYFAVVGATMLILARLGILGQVSSYEPIAEVK